MVRIVLAFPRASTHVALVGIFGAVPAGAGTPRIMMGRHFLSDVVFSVLFCALVLVGLYRVMGMRSFIGVTRRDLHADVRTMLPRRKVSKNIQTGQEPREPQVAAASRSTTEPTRPDQGPPIVGPSPPRPPG